MKRIVLVIFLAVQVVSQSAGWTLEMLPRRWLFGHFGVALWLTGFFLSLPGSLPGSYIIQHFLWMGPLTLVQLHIVDSILTVLFNAAFWALVYFLIIISVRAIPKNVRSRKIQAHYS
ncbi:MAG TPA: hypothetical protein VME86_14025 [Acidobacteriaceae bacterium]|nr:hypothetical protein [Acidobacteriaceae bacterium]